MKRWWTLPVLPAVVFGLGLPSAASASTHCTVSIIMTTLGTDGTSVSQTLTVPPNSNPQSPTSDSKVTNPATTANTNAANGAKPAAGGGGGGGGKAGGSNSGANALQSNVPSAATANPNDTPVTTNPDVGSIPVPTDEPTPPSPPILIPPEGPITPTPGDVIPVPGPGPVADGDPIPPTTDPTGPVAEAPEPGTLTLLGLAAIGGFGYARKKRKVV